MLVCYTCSKDLHNGTHNGLPIANGRKENEKIAPTATHSDWLKFSPEIAWYDKEKRFDFFEVCLCGKLCVNFHSVA